MTKPYTDVQIVGQFELLKKSCDARGFSIAIEYGKPMEEAECIVIRSKETGVVVHFSSSFVHASGFLDGVDYMRHQQQK